MKNDPLVSIKQSTVRRTSLFWFLFFSFVSNLFAQQTIIVKGRLLSGEDHEALPFATVLLQATSSDSIMKSSLSELDGTFFFSTTADNFYVSVMMVGFDTLIIKNLKTSGSIIDLKDLLLYPSTNELNAVILDIEQSQTTFKLDKRVFHVGEDLSNTGAGAFEVLNNVPSVNVSIEGEISLRGRQGIKILINGKPSVLASEEGQALGAITADMIERIEVITNPSAKYDAEGSSGIINIVLKKEDKKGSNGSVSVNTGYPHNHSLGFSINRRTDKFNIFNQLGSGYLSLPAYQNIENRNMLTNQSVNSSGTEFRNETYVNLILGTDYHIDKNQVLTLSGSFAYEWEDQPSKTTFWRTSSGLPESTWTRNEQTKADNPKYQYELQYQHTVKGNEKHRLQCSLQGNFFGKTLSSLFEHESSDSTLIEIDQRITTTFSESKQTATIDYQRPLSKKIGIEAGGQYVWQAVKSAYSVFELIQREWAINYNLTNVFSYEQGVSGLYGTAAYEHERWGFKAGTRVEITDLSTLLSNTGERSKQYYGNLFPSLHASYKVNRSVSFQVGYSRRILRPMLWHLNPFFNIRNNYSIRQGNPGLQAEYTDSYEFNSLFILNNTSFNVSVFHHKTSGVIERVSFIEDNITTTIPFNIGSNLTTGVEVNYKYAVGKKISFHGDFYINIFSRSGSFEETSFDFSSQRWSGKTTLKVKLPASFDLELTGRYVSAYQTLQGNVAGYPLLDVGLRKKKLLKGKAVLNLSVRDVFASRVREVKAEQNNFYSYFFRRRGRFITLGFSYGLGKGDAMEYGGKRR